MTPDAFTIEEKLIDVGDGHQLYAQLWGNPDAAETIVYLHGGPGSACRDSNKPLFDPKRHKVLFFDQRGCGKSLPLGSLVANDTDHSISDITNVAGSFGIDTFAITGGSWGSLLALAYAVANPTKVTRMILRGIYTSRQSENEFVEKGGYKNFFPEVWERFLAATPPEHHADAVGYHQKRILGSDPEAAKQSAYVYDTLEYSLIELDDRKSFEPYDTYDPSGTIVEVHFISQGCFIPDGYIMANAHKLTMPIQLVQGRYDFVCPPITAYELSQKLSNCQIFWTLAGHYGRDRGNYDVTKALLAAI